MSLSKWWAALAGLLLVAAPAWGAAPDVIVYGDPELAQALRDVGTAFTGRTGAPVHVFAAPPAGNVALIVHEVWNDVVVTLAPSLDAAEQAGVIEKGTRVGSWRNTLVLARAPGVSAGDVVAVTDATPVASVDGAAVLAAAGLHPAHVQGVATEADVAYLLESGAAAQGLLHLSAVRADKRLAVAGAVADAAYAPILYGAAISTDTHSPNAHAFLDFLTSAEAGAILRADGVERVP